MASGAFDFGVPISVVWERVVTSPDIVASSLRWAAISSTGLSDVLSIVANRPWH